MSKFSFFRRRSAERAELHAIGQERTDTIPQGSGNGSNEEWTGVAKDSKGAWVVCMAAFSIQVVLVGVLHAFGVFFVVLLEEFNCSKAAAAWLPSIAYGWTMLLSPIASIVIRRYGNHVAALIGSVICSISLLISSFSPSLQVMYFTFGTIYGVGLSLAYTPTMTISSDYFEKYVAVATGFMLAGSSIGTLTLTPLTQALVSGLGWRNAMRLLSAFVLIGLLCGYTFKPRRGAHRPTLDPSRQIKTSMTRRMIKDLKLWKNRVYVIWVFAMTLAMFGYYIPYVHLVSYATDNGISAGQGSLLVTALGASTATGRVMFGKIVDYGYLHRVQMDQLSLVITGTGAMLLPLIRTFPGLLTYVICIGLVDGCFVVLLPMLTTTLVGVENKVLAWGYLSGFNSITFMLGPPIAGWLYDVTGSYDLPFHVGGIPIILAALVLFFIPWAQRTGKYTNIMTAARSYNIMAEPRSVTSSDTFTASSDGVGFVSDTSPDEQPEIPVDSSQTNIGEDHRENSDDEDLQFVMLDLDPNDPYVPEDSEPDVSQESEGDLLSKLNDAKTELAKLLKLTEDGGSDAQSALSPKVSDIKQDVPIPLIPPPMSAVSGEEDLSSTKSQDASCRTPTPGSWQREETVAGSVGISQNPSSIHSTSGSGGMKELSPNLLVPFADVNQASPTVQIIQATSLESHNPFSQASWEAPSARPNSVSPPHWHPSIPTYRSQTATACPIPVHPQSAMYGVSCGHLPRDVMSAGCYPMPLSQSPNNSRPGYSSSVQTQHRTGATSIPAVFPGLPRDVMSDGFYPMPLSPPGSCPGYSSSVQSSPRATTAPIQVVSAGNPDFHHRQNTGMPHPCSPPDLPYQGHGTMQGLGYTGSTGAALAAMGYVADPRSGYPSSGPDVTAQTSLAGEGSQSTQTAAPDAVSVFRQHSDSLQVGANLLPSPCNEMTVGIIPQTSANDAKETEEEEEEGDFILF